jgi:cytochrome c oxidase assembly factor CtaG
MALRPLHIIGGVLALASGYVALYATKGAAAHRKSGTVFVFAMVIMSLTGAFIAVLNDSPVSVSSRGNPDTDPASNRRAAPRRNDAVLARAPSPPKARRA